MKKKFDCPECGKCFLSFKATADHIGHKHPESDIEPRRRKKPAPAPDHEMSLADISIEARLKQAMGEPLDPLEESLIFD